MHLRNFDWFTRMLRVRPLMLAASLYVAGCLLCYAFDLTLSCILVSLMILIAAGCVLSVRSKHLGAAVLILTMIPLGMLRFDTAWNAVQPLEDRKSAALSGRICEIPVWNAETERTICVLESLNIDGESISGTLRLYLRGDTDALQDVALADYISCEAHIWRADEATNPGQFSFANYLRVNGLRAYATAEIEDAEIIKTEIKPCERLLLARNAAKERISSLFPKNTALAHALILGDRSNLSDEDRESYSKSGAAHLLAISGMHVSVLALLISSILRRFLRRKSAFFTTLFLLVCYGVFIGFSDSLVRAIIMFGVLGYAPLCGRYSDGPTRISAALLIHLLLSPLAMLKSGFILSYGATAGIIFLYIPLQRLFKLENFISKRTDVGFISFIKRRIPQLIASSLLITAAAQLAILPAIVHFFGAQSVWSFLVNLLAAPLAMCGYIISITATLLNFAPLAVAGDFVFTLLTFWVRICSSLPLATLRIARFPLWLTLICILICLLSSDLSIIKQKFRSFMPLFILVAALISNLIAALSLNGCSIVFLDAGQADCAVIRTEGRVYLIDTGDSYTPAADYLSAMNYAPDAVFLSHPHTDHAGGLNNILDVCTPGIIYTSPNWHLYDIDESISESLLRAQAQGSQIVCISEGESIHLSDKTLLQVLSPSAGFSANSANDDSLILLLEHGNASALFLGDAQTSVSIDHLSDIDVLKVAHHGATDGLNAQFLARTTPSVAFIPVGYNNYGHPAGKTLDLLKSSGARVYRSDMHGAVTCRLDPDGSITVQPYFSSEDIHGLE